MRLIGKEDERLMEEVHDWPEVVEIEPESPKVAKEDNDRFFWKLVV
jgi:hypothetical protein